MKIAYLGPRGTFSEEAANGYYGPGSEDWLRCSSIPEVLEAVAQGQADEGIVPVENSISGTIALTIDTLLVYPDLFIKGEWILPVAQHLLAAEGVVKEDIKEIWTISPVISQCRSYIKQSGFATRNMDSTAAAAEAVRDAGRLDVAAIGSEWAAAVFGLQILERDIQDSHQNHTRFVVVCRGEQPVANANKTMLLLTPCEEHAGVLAAILNVLAALGINLSWIESRPTKRKLGNYQFFLDAEAGLEHPSMQKALAILRTLGHDIRILGSYHATTRG